MGLDELWYYTRLETQRVTTEIDAWVVALFWEVSEVT